MNWVLLSGRVPAQKEVWCIGDAVLRDIFTTWQNMRTQAEAKERPYPYTYANYNIEAFTAPQSCLVRSFLVRIVNAFAKGLNHRLNKPGDKRPPHLPRYVIIILHKDFIKNVDIYKFEVSRAFKDLLKWLLINLKNMIEVRKADLIGNRPGSVSSTAEPRLIWVQMIKRPEIAGEGKKIFALTRKFNTILEGVVAGDKRSHILKLFLEGTNANFDHRGNLTPGGKVAYWKILDDTMKDFDTGETELEPIKTSYQPSRNTPTTQWNKPNENWKGHHHHNRFKWVKPSKKY